MRTPNPTSHKPACLADFAAHVRPGIWREAWPGQAPAEREVHGEIWSDAIAAALQTGNVVRIPARATPYYLDRPIVLRSGQSLLADPAAEFRLKPGTNTCMVRNARVAAFHDGPVPPDLEPDRDIAIEGGIWTTLATAPSESNGNTRGRADAADSCPGAHGVILLHNVRDVTVCGVTIRQSRP